MGFQWLEISFTIPSLPIAKPSPKPGFAYDFCFHTSSNNYIHPLDEAKRALRLLADAGMNTLPVTLGRCHALHRGSLGTYGKYLDVAAISCDSSRERRKTAFKPHKQVFQVLLLDLESTRPDYTPLRNARHLTSTKARYQAFLDKHVRQTPLVPEDKDAMKDSYLLVTEMMCFLDRRDGSKKMGRSILDVGVETALLDSGFDEKTFLDRGGIFEWMRELEP